MNRPSSRRKSKSQTIELNLVPILDALVTLVSFLLFSTAFLSIVSIDSPVPLVAPAPTQIEELKEKPLQLTATIQKEQIVVTDWTASREAHTIPSVLDPKTGELRYDLEKFHQILVEIKHRFPNELKVILKPEAGVAYETLVDIVDSSRSFQKTDRTLFVKDKSGVSVPETKLFPDVIFGNIMNI